MASRARFDAPREAAVAESSYSGLLYVLTRSDSAPVSRTRRSSELVEDWLVPYMPLAKACDRKSGSELCLPPFHAIDEHFWASIRSLHSAVEPIDYVATAQL